MEPGSRSDLLQRISTFFQSFSSCAVELSSVNRSTCAQACRGQLRVYEDGGKVYAVKESDDLKCTLKGQKPLALLHRLDSSSKHLVEICHARTLQEGEKSNRASGPTLVYMPENQERAQAAATALRLIGAWKEGEEGVQGGRKNQFFTRSTSIRRTAATTEMSENHGHIMLGALLGYPVEDLFEMYKFVACSESDERRCKRFFLRDFVEVSRFLVEQHRVQL
ncbi:hypothetical protein GUITHDRAFT_143756 [Guillardia theta CCMP2712]|uniref:Uncharacterized protein n=1 Tax=Guillardia theta (strain CCMP2712) TaxID=905079 RepID=L1ITD5_GUITC|nr:hypothetical protein GUITHDRAFT_143756 [Guillardia theta CCMP2712]EKX39154.1 hypothetical protein GUITHDRAFT_143756 [Guillardia theta CCMP2712]|eukprot:XP_005826134.1 hypothetical protein GUITHDRAFT_143756 [Guillardia theta CCMP2712]